MPTAPTSSGGSSSSSGGAGVAPGLAAPLIGMLLTAVVNPFGINALAACRVVIPTTGTLRDISAYIGTSSGNVSAAVYSTASPRVRLATSGTIACPAGGAWRVLFDPALAVTAGEMYDFAFTSDNGTVTLGYWHLGLNATNSFQLPTSFLPGAGGTPLLTYSVNTAHPAPATIAEGSFATAAGLTFLLIGRIV